MTINIALATYDGIILGCDSLSSVVDYAIFPFRNDCEFARDAEGNLLIDANGHHVIPYGPHLTQVATTVFGGVNKMFRLYEDDDTCVAALTSGMATLLDITIAEQAKRFTRRNKLANRVFRSVEEVATEFKQYISEHWQRQFEGTPEAQRNYLPTIQFVVAGFGADDDYGKIFKIDVANNFIFEQFPDGGHVGIAWAGQADYVERLIIGIDAQIKTAAIRQMADAIARQRETTLSDINGALEAAGVHLPDDLHLEVTEHTDPTMPWDNARADIDYGNLSTQYAVDLVEMLVNTQSGMQRFARGIPTVGGRTHVGVLKRGEPFKILNAPDLQHKHTGYGHEY